jgi:hypothetical protein
MHRPVLRLHFQPAPVSRRPKPMALRLTVAPCATGLSHHIVVISSSPRVRLPLLAGRLLGFKPPFRLLSVSPFSSPPFVWLVAPLSNPPMRHLQQRFHRHFFGHSFGHRLDTVQGHVKIPSACSPLAPPFGSPVAPSALSLRGQPINDPRPQYSSTLSLHC